MTGEVVPAMIHYLGRGHLAVVADELSTKDAILLAAPPALLLQQENEIELLASWTLSIAL